MATGTLLIQSDSTSKLEPITTDIYRSVFDLQQLNCGITIGHSSVRKRDIFRDRYANKRLHSRLWVTPITLSGPTTVQ